ncbi:MAG TPA: tetratricopeptide repeat protein [Pyrinomonadaceae bacterium]|nr:tetratricopeptide repeat protein [Pyrinomonadaceae bacterium]
MQTVNYYCQKCLAPNPFGQELCGRCGTRLMLIVEPPTGRFETDMMGAGPEEHLLERVSALENRLMRITDRLEQSLNLLLRQARNSYFDHALLESLISLLSEAGTVDREKLEGFWHERCQRDSLERDEIERRERLRAEIVAGYKGQRAEDFAQDVAEGMELLTEGLAEQAVQTLERASALSPQNIPLLAFIGEHFFRAGRMAPARSYLQRAFDLSPGDDRVCLLLGLALGDEGEAESAKKLLSDAVKRGHASFAAHYGLGRILAAEERWREALQEFKRALAVRSSPEAHYVVGCVYYQLGHDRMAGRHLRKALEMDGEYAAALYVLGLVLLRTGERARARHCFQSAREKSSSEPRYAAAARNMLKTPGRTAPHAPFFNVARTRGRRLVTCGDKRLADAVITDALNSSGASDKER